MSFFRKKQEEAKERNERLAAVEKNRPEVAEFINKLHEIEKLKSQISQIWQSVPRDVLEKHDKELYTDAMESGCGVSGWPKTYDAYKKWEESGERWGEEREESPATILPKKI